MTVISNPLSEADELPPYPGVNNNNNNAYYYNDAAQNGNCPPQNVNYNITAPNVNYDNPPQNITYYNNNYTDGEYIDGGRLYDNEQESDVTFVAGIGGDTWRLPGHRAVLSSANLVFQAMLTGPWANDNIIYVTDVDKRAFEQLMRYLYRQKVTLPSVSTARMTLEAAHKYICPDLVKLCVVFLDLHLERATVIEIFRNLRFYCTRIPTSTSSTEPSAPPPPEDTSEEVKMTNLCDSLMHNCLLFIDENADDILCQEGIEELSFEDISIIVSRDTLGVKSELILFNALNRWCISECKRCKTELTPANRRQVLGQLSYSVRYLLMSESEFLQGPKASELLDLFQCDLIIRRMRKDKSVYFTAEQEELLRKFASPRISSAYIQPVNLSQRSIPRNPVDVDNRINKKIDSKKTRKQKKKEAKEERRKKKTESDEDSNCSCSCFGQGLLRAFLFIFD